MPPMLAPQGQGQQPGQGQQGQGQQQGQPQQNQPQGGGVQGAAPVAPGGGGVVDLPLPGTKGAPKKFKGKHSEVLPFFHFYDRLCQKHHVTTDHDKVTSITQYCSRAVHKFMEGLASYQTPNWNAFVRDIQKYYEADKDSKRYATSDLQKLSHRSRSKSIKTLKAWNRYMRDFIRIGGWLMQNSLITDRDYKYYFWMGINEDFRDKVESRLVARLPNHDMSTPFEVDDVISVAESLLHRRRFDQDRLVSEVETGDSDSDTSSSDSSDSESESDMSEDDKVKKKKKPKKRSKSRESSRVKSSAKSKTQATKKPAKRTVRIQSPEPEAAASSDSDAPPSRMTYRPSTPVKEKSRDDPEMEELIGQLKKMQIDDPAYAISYFRAVNRNPLVKEIVAAPVDRRQAAAPAAPTAPRSRNFERETPPHLGAGAQSFQTRPENRTCFGCGALGHTMSRCDKLQEYFTNGTISRDEKGFISLTSGAPLYRRRDEDWVSAIKRATQPQASYVSVHAAQKADKPKSPRAKKSAVQYYSCESESQQDQGQPSSPEEESEVDVLEATRADKTITSNRKERFDGVWIPTPKELEERRKKQNLPPTPFRRGPPRGARGEAGPSRAQVPVSVPAPDPVPVPVDVSPPTFNPNDDDAFMEDLTRPPPPSSKGKQRAEPMRDITNHKAKLAGGKTDVEGGLRRQPRRSDVQAQSDPKNMLSKVLNAPITIAVGELLGVSKEMAQQVQEVIKPKNAASKAKGDEKAVVTQYEARQLPSQAPACATAITFPSRPRGQLIRLKLEVDGNPITAIIDTGSQLNIVNRRVWQSTVGRPIDVTKQIIMGDANGGEGVLQGFVSDVPLTCGAVTTYASLFIGTKAPFDLLLGRPWQRGNYVSIDERIDGTYLLFKDRSMVVRYEMLVSPEQEVDPALQEYLDRTHHLVNVVTGVETADVDLDFEFRAPRLPRRQTGRVAAMLQNARIQEIDATSEDSTLSTDDPGSDAEGPSSSASSCESIDTVAETPPSSGSTDVDDSDASEVSADSEIIRWLDLLEVEDERPSATLDAERAEDLPTAKSDVELVDTSSAASDFGDASSESSEFEEQQREAAVLFASHAEPTSHTSDEAEDMHEEADSPILVNEDSRVPEGGPPRRGWWGAVCHAVDSFLGQWEDLPIPWAEREMRERAAKLEQQHGPAAEETQRRQEQIRRAALYAAGLPQGLVDLECQAVTLSAERESPQATRAHDMPGDAKIDEPAALDFSVGVEADAPEPRELVFAVHVPSPEDGTVSKQVIESGNDDSPEGSWSATSSDEDSETPSSENSEASYASAKPAQSEVSEEALQTIDELPFANGPDDAPRADELVDNAFEDDTSWPAKLRAVRDEFERKHACMRQTRRAVEQLLVKRMQRELTDIDVAEQREGFSRDLASWTADEFRTRCKSDHDQIWHDLAADAWWHSRVLIRAERKQLLGLREAAQAQRDARWRDSERLGSLAAALHDRHDSGMVLSASISDGPDPQDGPVSSLNSTTLVHDVPEDEDATDAKPVRPARGPSSRARRVRHLCAKMPDPLQVDDVDPHEASEWDWMSAVNRRSARAEDRAYLQWRRSMQKARRKLWKSVSAALGARQGSAHLSREQRTRLAASAKVFDEACETASGRLWVARYLASLQLRDELRNVTRAFKDWRECTADPHELQESVSTDGEADCAPCVLSAQVLVEDLRAKAEAFDFDVGQYLEDRDQSNEAEFVYVPTRPTTPTLQELDAAPQPGNSPQPLTRQRWRPELLHNPLREEDVIVGLADEEDWDTYVQIRNTRAEKAAQRECRNELRAADRGLRAAERKIAEDERKGEYSPVNVWHTAQDDRCRASQTHVWTREAAQRKLHQRQQALARQLAEERAAIHAAFHPPPPPPTPSPSESSEPNVEARPFVGMALARQEPWERTFRARSDAEGLAVAGPLAPFRATAVPGAETRVCGFAPVLASSNGLEASNEDLGKARGLLSAQESLRGTRTCVSSAEHGKELTIASVIPPTARNRAPEPGDDVSVSQDSSDMQEKLAWNAARSADCVTNGGAGTARAEADEPATDVAADWVPVQRHEPGTRQDRKSLPTNPDAGQESCADEFEVDNLGRRVSHGHSGRRLENLGLMSEIQPKSEKENQEARDAPEPLAPTSPFPPTFTFAILSFSVGRPFAFSSPRASVPRQMADALLAEERESRPHTHLRFDVKVPPLVAQGATGRPDPVVSFHSVCFAPEQARYLMSRPRAYFAFGPLTGTLAVLPMSTAYVVHGSFRELRHITLDNVLVLWIPAEDALAATVVESTTCDIRMLDVCNRSQNLPADGFQLAAPASLAVLYVLCETDGLFREYPEYGLHRHMLTVVIFDLTGIPDHKAGLDRLIEGAKNDWPRKDSVSKKLFWPWEPDEAGFWEWLRDANKRPTAKDAPRPSPWPRAIGDRLSPLHDRFRGNLSTTTRLVFFRNPDGGQPLWFDEILDPMVEEMAEIDALMAAQGFLPAGEPMTVEERDATYHVLVTGRDGSVRRESQYVGARPRMTEEEWERWKRIDRLTQTVMHASMHRLQDERTDHKGGRFWCVRDLVAWTEANSTRGSRWIYRQYPSARSAFDPVRAPGAVIRHPATGASATPGPSAGASASPSRALDPRAPPYVPGQPWPPSITAHAAAALDNGADLDKIWEEAREKGVDGIDVGHSEDEPSASAEGGASQDMIVDALTPFVCRRVSQLEPAAVAARTARVLHITAAEPSIQMPRPPTPFIKSTHAVPLFGTPGMCPSPLELPPPFVTSPPSAPSSELYSPDFASPVSTRPLRVLGFDVHTWHSQMSISTRKTSPEISPRASRQASPVQSLTSEALGQLHELLGQVVAEQQSNAARLVLAEQDTLHEDQDPDEQVVQVWNQAFAANARAMLEEDVLSEMQSGTLVPTPEEGELPVVEEVDEEPAVHADPMDEAQDAARSSESSDSDSGMSSGQSASTGELSIEPYTSPLCAEDIRLGHARPDMTMEIDTRSSSPPFQQVRRSSRWPSTQASAQDTSNTQNQRGRVLALPNPRQALGQYQRSGRIGTLTLAGAVAIRNILVALLREELFDAVGAGLLRFVDDNRLLRNPATRGSMETIYPYNDTYGTPFLWAQEQIRLRQYIQFWKANNADGSQDERITRLERALHFRPGGRNGERDIRRLRQDDRLGPLGYGRDVVSHPPRGPMV
ncbi:hypothetical protein PsYK624_135050 [Phanerochaete sordida]|uniref:DUF4100 domain-containing protein n=1 Tax=Phanerochaete sordida TaxID=48140 RepID=A0A9P3GN48_9APHY|nr:hypothetical protein PsYK624_135050 [Phanerochaete sordida]